MQNICAVIDEKLREKMPEVSAIKNIKNLPAPDKYAGEDDLEFLLNWLKALLCWLLTMRLGGPALEEE